jgi:hypothetical protein
MVPYRPTQDRTIMMLYTLLQCTPRISQAHFKIQVPWQPHQHQQISLQYPQSQTYQAPELNTYNFTGVYQFVKFSWDNAAGNTGTIDKILYRQ